MESETIEISIQIKIPINQLQLAKLSSLHSFIINEHTSNIPTEQVIHNAHRLQNISHRIWNTHRINPNPSLLFSYLLDKNPLQSSSSTVFYSDFHTTPRPGSPSTHPTQPKAPPPILSTAPTHVNQDSPWSDNLTCHPVTSSSPPSSSSSPSLVSPIVPVTPNNSSVSAGISSSFLPSAPPPTPSENGAHLPTTMSAKLKTPQRVSASSHLPPAITTAAGGGKKKAKFFIKESEADDDKFSSPPMAPIQPSHVPLSHIPNVTNDPIPQLKPVAEATERSAPPQNPNNQPQPAPGRDGEELDGTDSDEWGSEYSDDEDVNVTIEAAKLRELKKKQEDEYYRQLFAKKHFDQRNQSHDGSDQPPPIRRAGLSMLFHPELNHLQHHPRSIQRTESVTSPALIRNQSALELRRQGSSSSSTRRPGEKGSPNLSTTRGPRLSLGLLPRPSSLIKSKSSVAVPVLAGHEPPAMVQRSPSSHDAQSSAPPHSQRAPPGDSSGDSITNSSGHVVQQLPPPPHQKQQQPPNHQRHLSRLGGKPENVEYSDDDSDSDQEGEARGASKNKAMIQMTEEQEKRLGRLVKKSENPTTLPPPATQSKTVLTDPMALNINTACRPQPMAPPLSPRTTRKNFLSNELTESLRRNLIWERQMRAQAFGIMLNDNNNNDLINENNEINGGLDHLVNNGLLTDALNRNNNRTFNNNSTTNNKGSSSSNNVNKEYRNFSKGFHRTGW